MTDQQQHRQGDEPRRVEVDKAYGMDDITAEHKAPPRFEDVFRDAGVDVETQ